ncbi:uncharacterized protein TNCV_3091111 [Trichonephila clavipes]|uniref:Uncharacterized protein n=1 Tax=Trichonephila clavipes TaxID=2585209 RepID=A0A8X6W8L7_TRICX|nr:uncharacterized protein TNCV_3091111 [Trichonephila clavipes]
MWIPLELSSSSCCIGGKSGHLAGQDLTFETIEQWFFNCGPWIPGEPRRELVMAAVAEWYRYRTVTCFVTGSSPVPLKTRRVGQRCTLNLTRAETSSRWCGVVVRRGGASSDVVHVT